MNEIEGTFRSGQIVPDQPVDWPEGCRVLIQPVSATQSPVGMSEEEQSDPTKIAEWLARFDALEPLELTPEDEAEIAAAREAVKRVTLEAVRRRMETIE
jgi:hypothetical protein